jgi:hypothetical protein
MSRHRFAVRAAVALVALACFGTGARSAGSLPARDPVDTLGSRDVEVLLKFEMQPLSRILEALRAAAGFRLEIEGDLSTPATVALDRRTPVREVLADLASRYGLRYEVPNKDTLVVHAAKTAAGS